MKIDLILKDMKDQLVRENFYRVQQFLMSQTVLNPDFKFFEIDVPAANTHFSIPHGLDYAPTDLIVMSAIGDNRFYFRYDLFDKTNVYVVTQGPVRLRFLLGRYPGQGRRPLNEGALPFVAP